MTQLIVLVCLYMLVSVGIGLWAARRVRNTADYALAGRGSAAKPCWGCPGALLKAVLPVLLKNPSVPAWRWSWSGCFLPVSSTR